MIGLNILTINLSWTLAVLLFGALEYLMPELTRREVMFSVTVPRELMQSAGSGVVRRYRRTLAASIVLALITVLANPHMLSGWSGGSAFAIEYAGFVIAFFTARRQIQKHAIAAAPIRDADLTEHDPSSAVVVVVALPLLAMGSVALWTYNHWNVLPDLYPIHWTLGLEPDAWVRRTPMHVYGLLGLLTGATALIAVLCFGLLFWSRRLGASRRSDRSATVAITLLLFAEYVMAANAMLPLGLSADGTELAIFIAIVGASAYLIVVGRGGAFSGHSGRFAPSSDPTPDAAWKAGLLYFNPDDPALFVEKRFGLGWTINFGNPWAWAVVCMAFIPMVLGIVFVLSVQT